MIPGKQLVNQTPLLSLLTVIICTIPHFLNISWLVIIICLIMWACLFFSIEHKIRAPGPVLRSFLGTLLFAAAVGLHEGLTVEAFVALLSLMLSLKLFELQRQRDAIITIILCYFLIVSSMFFNDSLLTFIYILFAILWTTTVLISVNFPGIDFRPAFSLAVRLTLQAMPVMVVLFLIFPRVQVGIWGRPALINAKSGFTDSISLGTISHLARSSKPAFRVEFADRPPPPGQRYWRGIVLTHFDGTTWKQKGRRSGVPTGTVPSGEMISYTITMEPHNQHWLFTLDLPARVETPQAWGLADYSWYRWRPVTGRLQYAASSRLQTQALTTGQDHLEALRLPESGNIKSRAMAEKWWSEATTSSEFLLKALDFFRTNDFTYTLEPRTVAAIGSNKNSIDTFLFTTREGFCEHFATAFAYLMRAGGIPARLVGGYLGGTLNPFGDYMVVRQSDAHVWCEVLLDDGAWHRIDPTALVEPARILTSLPALLAESETDSPFSLFGIGKTPEWLKTVADFRDLVNSRWNQWVMGYSSVDQIRLISRLGINVQIPSGMFQTGILCIVALLAAWLLILAMVRKGKTSTDAVAVTWMHFCSKMEKSGVPRLPHQGPVDYLNLITSVRPDLADAARNIVDQYVELRYAKKHDTHSLETFTRAVRSFSPNQK